MKRLPWPKIGVIAPPMSLPVAILYQSGCLRCLITGRAGYYKLNGRAMPGKRAKEEGAHDNPLPVGRA